MTSRAPRTPDQILSPPTRRTALGWLASAGLACGLNPLLVRADPALWNRTLEQARGQSVYFYAWGGSPPINDYIQWAAKHVLERFDIKVTHVKVQDTADVVRQVRSEVAAGKPDGSVDLLWINGANFSTMKRERLLFGPFAEQLPAFANVDTKGKPTTMLDFAEPVDGMEAPWGMAQLTFMADSKRVKHPPRKLSDWLAFAAQHPGRSSYPRPPDFHGMTFIKQALIDLTPLPDRQKLYQPVTPELFTRIGGPLWRFLDSLHPHLWRQGKQFPTTAAAQRQMMSDGELLLALTFNPNEVANEIAAKRLSATTVSFQFKGGTIGNSHFLAIPINARAKPAAQVLINFFLSPQAQARKADIAVWGDPTVLDVRRLSPSDRSLFQSSVQPGQLLDTAPALPEPHESWVAPLQNEWTRRYGM